MNVQWVGEIIAIPYSGLSFALVKLLLQVVVLILLIAAIRDAKMKKDDSLKTHHVNALLAVAVNTIGIIFTIIPSLPSNAAGLTSPQLLVLVVHGVFWFLGFVLVALCALGVRPRKLQPWMRITALFWLIALTFGFIAYLTITIRV